MKRHRKLIVLIVSIILLRRVSQIIFDVFYTTSKNSYLGITSGARVQGITSEWYEEKHIGLFTNSIPIPYQESKLGIFQDKCRFWQGNCVAFDGQDAFSSFRRIDSIQYIAREVDTQVPSDLTNRFGLLYDIDPKRYYPYILLQYIGTPSKTLAENNPDNPGYTIARNNVINLWEKGIGYQCDTEKIKKIEKLDYQEFINAVSSKDLAYRQPCKEGWELAHMLAFNYFYYMWNKEKSILYYKVASFHDDVPSITSSMPAIILGSVWDHQTSAYLWYDNLQNNLSKIQNWKKYTNEEEKNLEDALTKALQKSVSEYSLHILDEASKLAITAWAENVNAYNQSYLYNQWYIKTIIQKEFSDCTPQDIDCSIIRLGQQQWRIQTNGVLTYSDPSYHYIRDEKKSHWEIKRI